MKAAKFLGPAGPKSAPLNQAVLWAAEQRKAGRTVLVHCAHGHGRRYADFDSPMPDITAVCSMHVKSCRAQKELQYTACSHPVLCYACIMFMHIMQALLLQHLGCYKHAHAYDCCTIGHPR